jgi:dTMP kinase
VLISFEGIDGCGKTTQIGLLKNRLIDELQEEVSVYREPGGTGLSEQIRSILLDSSLKMDSVTEVLLFSAARSQLICERVKPELDVGKIVILDRYFDSTTAYQGYGRDEIDPEAIQQLNTLATHQVLPEITFYLKLTLDEARERQDEVRDRVEQSDDAFFERVIHGFDQLAQTENRFITIDATLPKPTVHQMIWDSVVDRLK